MIYFVQRYTVRASQPFANKLSTPPPTANGDNCGYAQNFLHGNRRKSVTYPESRFPSAPDRFLTKALKVTYYKVCSGWQTPYPQKRQQTLGATSALLWKTAGDREFSVFARGLPLKNTLLFKKQSIG